MSVKTTKPMSPLLRPKNRKQLIEEAMQAISDKQAEVIKQAAEIIGDVKAFENDVDEKFVIFFGKK